MSVDITQSRERLADFLSKHGVGVLATSSKEGKPYAATIYLTYDRQFNIYFVTKKDTQKSRNLQNNNQAAIAIYDATTQTTVQVEGAVVEVTNSEEATWVINDIWRIAMNISPNNPPPQAHLSAGNYVAYKLIAPSLRMATFLQSDPANYDKIFEVVSTRPGQEDPRM